MPGRVRGWPRWPDDDVDDAGRAGRRPPRRRWRPDHDDVRGVALHHAPWPPPPRRRRATALPPRLVRRDLHARTLLVTVPEPAVVAAEMARLTRPGGWVVSVEPDTEFMLCYPRSAAYDRIAAFFPPVFRRNGADPWIGRSRVSELLRQAGLEDIGMKVTAQAYPAGHTRRAIRLDLLKSIWAAGRRDGAGEPRRNSKY